MEIKRFTANYINTDSNFLICNVEKGKKKDEYYSLYCLLINLLQRGCPTRPTDYLQKYIDKTNYSRKIHLLSNNTPDWKNTIKGYDKKNKYPARDFYYNVIPKNFKDFPFLQQIIIPEVPIDDFIPPDSDDYKNQDVDFLIEDVKLVIEIDGKQHDNTQQKFLDNKRDEYIKSYGYTVVRIPANEIRNSDYLMQIRTVLGNYDDLLKEYSEDYKLISENLMPTEVFTSVAIMRLQIAILYLCVCGKLSLNDKKWNIKIKNYEVKDYEQFAIEDLFIWFKNLCFLSGQNFHRPEVVLQNVDNFNKTNKKDICIDFTLLDFKAIDDNTNDKTIYVMNSLNRIADNFQLLTAKPITYTIDDTGVSEDDALNEPLNNKRKALRYLLKNIFGFDDFLPGQERIVINALKRRDTIGVLPTGSGKSLCYQLAALLQPCISFVVCPIKSLMIDQDQNLKKNGITHTAFISSDLTPKDRSKVQKNFADNKYWWVFVSPERFQSEEFRDYILDMASRLKVSFGYAVIDEVHCLSEWGHSFRVSYLNLIKTIKKLCDNVALIGLTATASFNVLKNILIEFNMNDKNDVISIPTFTRKELNFKVEKCKNDKYPDLKKLIDKYQSVYPDILDKKGESARCGIIFTPYVNSYHGCYHLSNILAEQYDADIRCFAGSKPARWPEDNDWESYKRQVQNDYKDNKFSLLCATKAFGMGIDKPNIRYVVHYGLPSSLESLYQEAGRAGRDKKKAQCTVLYNRETVYDATIRRFLGLDIKPSEIKQFFEENRNKWDDQHDSYRQLLLLSGELSDIDEELKIIDWLVDEFVEPDSANFIQCPSQMSLNDLQKYIYHLSIIGVVRDWTVDWKSNTVKVYFSKYSYKQIIKTTEEYIKNYDANYNINSEESYLKVEAWNDNLAIHVCSEIFLTWYSDNILYSRRQALLNVIEACDSFSTNKANEFKEKMEAYFRLDDVADMLGIIADEPENVEEWFNVLNTEKISKTKASNMSMNINRFLESYQNNTGLNYVSGIVNLLDGNFDSPNGRIRLLSSFNSIKDFSDKDKEAILKNTTKVFSEMDDLDNDTKENYSRFFIENYDLDNTSEIIYKHLKDSYSLSVIMSKALCSMIDDVGGK